MPKAVKACKPGRRGHGVLSGDGKQAHCRSSLTYNFPRQIVTAVCEVRIGDPLPNGVFDVTAKGIRQRGGGSGAQGSGGDLPLHSGFPLHRNGVYACFCGALRGSGRGGSTNAYFGGFLRYGLPFVGDGVRGNGACFSSRIGRSLFGLRIPVLPAGGGHIKPGGLCLCMNPLRGTERRAL